MCTWRNSLKLTKNFLKNQFQRQTKYFSFYHFFYSWSTERNPIRCSSFTHGILPVNKSYFFLVLYLANTTKLKGIKQELQLIIRRESCKSCTKWCGLNWAKSDRRVHAFWTTVWTQNVFLPSLLNKQRGFTPSYFPLYSVDSQYVISLK